MADTQGLGPCGATHGGSTPSVRTIRISPRIREYAGVAQLAERDLAKVDVAGSNPVSRLSEHISYVADLQYKAP